MQRLFAANDGAESAFGDVKARLFDVGRASAVAGAKVEPFARFVEHQERRHLGAHQLAGLPGDCLERFVNIQRGRDGLADIEERFEPASFEADLFVEPRVFDDVRSESGEVMEKLFIGFVECV